MKKSWCLLLLFALILGIFPLVLAVGESGEITVEFANQAGRCRSFADHSYWLNEFGQKENETVIGGLAVGDCFEYDEARGEFLTEEPFCCPSSWDTCLDDSYPGGRCVEDVGLCENIGASGSCNHASSEIAEEQLDIYENFTTGYVNNSTGQICYDYYSANCLWVINDSDKTGSCIATTVKIENINDSVDGTCPYDQTSGKCLYTITDQVSRCDTAEQIIIINYSAMLQKDGAEPEIPQADSWCKNKSMEYACSASIQLPAFSFFNFLISIFGIGVVYVLFKKNYKGKA